MPWYVAIGLWSLLGDVFFEDDFSIGAILATIATMYFIHIVTPLVRVIICNYRKVPYHG